MQKHHFFIEECQQVHQFFRACVGAKANSFVGHFGSNATFLISPSASMAFLNSAGAFAMMEQVGC
jgi:hypothetical protein